MISSKIFLKLNIYIWGGKEPNKADNGKGHKERGEEGFCGLKSVLKKVYTL